jgi:hypothetical protein
LNAHGAPDALLVALNAASDACHAAPNRPESHYAYGQAWSALGNHPNAERAFAAALQLAPRCSFSSAGRRRRGRCSPHLSGSARSRPSWRRCGAGGLCSWRSPKATAQARASRPSRWRRLWRQWGRKPCRNTGSWRITIWPNSGPARTSTTQHSAIGRPAMRCCAGSSRSRARRMRPSSILICRCSTAPASRPARAPATPIRRRCSSSGCRAPAPRCASRSLPRMPRCTVPASGPRSGKPSRPWAVGTTPQRRCNASLSSMPQRSTRPRRARVHRQHHQRFCPRRRHRSLRRHFQFRSQSPDARRRQSAAIHRERHDLQSPVRSKPDVFWVRTGK